MTEDAKAPKQWIKNDVGDWVCEHGTAADVHCCHCHSGFIFDQNHKCPEAEDATIPPTPKTPQQSRIAYYRAHWNGGGHLSYRELGEVWADYDALAAERDRLRVALKDIVEDLEARWDMNDPQTNPGIRHNVQQAKDVLR